MKSGVNSALVGVDVTSTQSMTAALYGLDAAQQKVALSALKRAGANTTELESNLANLSGIKLLSAAKANEIVTNNLLTKDAEKNILTQINSAAADNLKKFGVDGVTQAELKRILATNGVTGAEAESILSSYAATTAKTVEAGATNVLTTALWNNIKALVVWLATNPVGWIIDIGVAVYATATIIQKNNQKIIDSNNDVIESSKSNIDSYEQEISKLQDLSTKLQESKTDRSQLLSVVGDLNDAIGDSTSLLSGESSAFDAADSKIQARIQALKDLVEAEKNHKVAAEKSNFEDTGTNYKFGTDDLSVTGFVVNLDEAVKQLDKFKKSRKQLIDLGAQEDSIGIKDLDTKIKRYEGIIEGKITEAKSVFEDYVQQEFPDEVSQGYINQYISDLIYGGTTSLDDINSKIKDFEPIITEYNDLYNSISNAKTNDELKSSEQTMLSFINSVKTKFPEASQTIKDLETNFYNLGDIVSSKFNTTSLSSQLETTTSQLSQYANTLDSLFSNGKINDKFKKLFGDDETEYDVKQQISETFSGASDSVQSGILDIVEKVKDGTYDYQDAMTKFSLVGATEVQGIGDQLAASITSDAFGDLDGLDGMIDSWKELSSALKETADCVDLVKSAQDELNSTGSISIETALDLIEKNSDYADILKVDTNGGITLVDNAEQVLIGTKINAIKASAQQQLADARAAVKSLESAEKFKDTAQTIKNDVIPVYAAFSGSAAYLGSIFSDIFSGNFSGILDRAKTAMQSALDEANSKIVDISKDSEELAQARKDLEDATKFNNIAQNLTIDNFSKKYSPTSSKDTNSKDIEEYVADIDKLYSGKEKLVEIQNEIKRLSSINDITDSDVEKVQNLNQIIILYKQEQDALHALNQERRNEISAQVDTLKSQGFDVLYDPDSNKLVINNLEHINKLQGKTTEETNEIRKAAEKLIDTVQSENSDAIQSSQDWLGVLKNINGAYNDIKQSAKDALEESQKGLEDDINSIKSTVNKAFDEISKLLSKEKESYETQKSNLESVASTVTSYINTYTDSLQSENDELEKQISLQQKLEALDKAKTQRNKRIFKSGKGFIWGADESAVNSAQEEYDSALKEYNLNKQIQELKDYAKAWQDAVNSYETSANEALTASILGSNWRSKVLGTNYSLVKNFKGDYTSVLSELDDSVYGSVAYQIKNLDNLKDEWSNAVDEAEDTSTDYKTVLDLVKTYESSNYSDRLNEMSKFVTSMKEQYKELTAAYRTVTAAIPTATSGSIQYDKDENYAQKILDSTTLSEAQAYAALRNAKISGENITGVASTQYFLDQWKPRSSSSSYSSSSTSSSSSSGSKASSVAKTVISSIGNVVSTISKNLFGFSEGGIVDDTGIAMLHGGNGHNEVVLNSNSADNVWKYIQSGDALANSAAMLMLANKISLGDNLAPNADQNINLNIGDIYLSGVDDSSGLANDIVKRLPAQILQKLHRR